MERSRPVLSNGCALFCMKRFFLRYRYFSWDVFYVSAMTLIASSTNQSLTLTSCVDLKYQVPQLKKISNELRSRTIQIHLNNSLNSTSTQSPIAIYVPPKSGAKKAEWASAISTYFNLHGGSNNDFYDLLNGTTLATVTDPSSTAPPVPARSPSAASKISTTNIPGNNTPVAQAARVSLANVSTNKPPSAAGVARMSPTKKSPRKKMNKSPPKPTIGHGPTTSLHIPATATSVLHIPIHNQFPPADLNPFCRESNNHTTSVPTTITATKVPDPEVGMKRAATTSPIRSARPIQPHSNVNRHPISQTLTYQFFGAAALTATTKDDSSTPRDFRETAMLSNLRQMGFRNEREILNALRAVAAQRVENSAQWSVQEQVDSAMTWIVTQREEAAFARELDRARILSEQENSAQEHSRKQLMANEVEHASVVDLLGSTETRSKYFPHSVLLRDRSVVNSVLSPVASGSSNGKKQVIRLLNLELKSRKWYGTVLPYSYFQYVLCPSFGSWAGNDIEDLSQKVEQVSDELEKAMFNLSEQVEGGFGSVPKLFYDAQTKATREEKPISALEDSEVIIDDDVAVLEKPRGGSKTQLSDVINIA